MAPTALADPGPYRVDGLALTLWTYAVVAPERPSAHDVGVALAMLHEALASHPGPLPVLTPVHELVDDGLAALERQGVAGLGTSVHAAVDPALVAALRDAHAEILRDLAVQAGQAIVLHGDAHPGNLLRVGERWLWTDLEETCTGPLAWDLAVLSQGDTPDGSEAVGAYAAAAGVPVPAAGELEPFARARRLEAAVWTLGMAQQHPARYAPLAEDLVKSVLAW